MAFVARQPAVHGLPQHANSYTNLAPEQGLEPEPSG